MKWYRLPGLTLLVCFALLFQLAGCSSRQPEDLPLPPPSASQAESLPPESEPESQTGESSSQESSSSAAPVSSQTQESTVPVAQPVVQTTSVDLSYITSHVGFGISQTLGIYQPAGAQATTNQSNFFISGSSNPELELYMNGSPVASRGVLGSFSVYVALDSGENVFEFSQGDVTKTVTIIRSSSYEAATTKSVSSMFPSYDNAVASGEAITIKCTAPSGGSVTATIGGESISLSQNAAASDGVPAVFSGSYTPPEVSGTKSMGAVVYTLSYNGSTKNFTSGGKLYAVGSGSSLAVEVINQSASIFSGSTGENSFVTTAKKGAVDTVTGFSDSRYRLSMGGWVQKDTVKPLPGTAKYTNEVSSAVLTKDEYGDVLTLKGTEHPIYTAARDGSSLTLTLHDTTGVGSIDASSSFLFSSISASESSGNTILTFTLKNPGSLWGYLVEYKEGKTIISCKAKPSLSEGAQPLKSVTIALDPGHGGTDSGAVGIPGAKGTAEKHINLATAIATQKYLQSLGAKVVLTREGDVNPDLNKRLEIAQDSRADIFIALHCNSTPYNRDYSKPNGVEVYYYENTAKALANALQGNLPSYTGRLSRGAQFSYFRVTLNSYAPSVLVEMGFMNNAKDFDSMCSRKGIYNTAKAVSESVISLLRNPS